MTWHDLTFTASHMLTASDMNRMQENFTALAQGDSGAPALSVSSLMVTGVASIATLHVSGEATLGGGGLPTGAVIPFAGTAAPAGWLLCAGQPVSRAAYAGLFALIGETFGAGDGSATFNVPDLRGRTVVALDNLGGSSANAIAAAWAGSLGGAGGHELLQSHTHGAGTLSAQTGGAHDHSYDRITGSQPSGSGVQGATSTIRNAATASTAHAGHGHTISGNTGSAGAGDAQNVQPSIALGYIIKT